MPDTCAICNGTGRELVLRIVERTRGPGGMWHHKKFRDVRGPEAVMVEGVADEQLALMKYEARMRENGEEVITVSVRCRCQAKAGSA